MNNYDAFTPELKKVTVKLIFQAENYYGSMTYVSHTHNKGFLLMGHFNPADLLDEQWIRDNDVEFTHMKLQEGETEWELEESYAEITLDDREGMDCKTFCVTASDIAKMIVGMSIEDMQDDD